MTPSWFSLSYYSLRKVIIPHFPCDGLNSGGPSEGRVWNCMKHQWSNGGICAPGLFSCSVFRVFLISVFDSSPDGFWMTGSNFSCLIFEDGSSWGCGKDICLLLVSKSCQIRCGSSYRFQTNSNSFLHTQSDKEKTFTVTNISLNSRNQEREVYVTVFMTVLQYLT